MAKVISTLFISADGVAEIDPDWHFPYFDENMGRAVGEDYDTSDVLLIGRVTYDSFAGAWPDREAAGGDDASFAKQLGDVRKVVVSRQPLEFSWRNSELIEGDLVDAVSALKADAGIEASSSPARSPWCSSCSPQGWSTSCACWCTRSRRARAAGCSTRATRPTTCGWWRRRSFPTGVIRVIYSPTAGTRQGRLRRRQGPGARGTVAALQAGHRVIIRLTPAEHVRRPG